MQDPIQPDPSERPVLFTPDAQGTSVDTAAMDLVQAASEEGDDGVVRNLLRALVGLGLTTAAGYWRQTSSRQWLPLRGFGGPTPAPTFPEIHGAGPQGHLSWAFGAHGAIVVERETFDRDGQRLDREAILESLVILAETLLCDEAGQAGSDPASHPGPSPAPRRAG